ncbi:MAG: non-heme iron oxygenase ferredoxin subunit [Burkholderiales bacterium]|nr:non-heme iron oxygenase ferredoxin subunit [Burkholderiales bacterium]
MNKTDTQDWEAACPADSLREGEPRGLKLKGIPIALYKVEGCVYATHDECTHAYALLSDGFIDGHTIECTLHGAMYDVRDGKCLAFASCDVKTYPVQVQDGMVKVLLSPAGSDDRNGNADGDGDGNSHR